MATIFPFKALMPSPPKAHLVAAPPYDVVTRNEALKLAEGNPLTFLRVSRSEIELSTDTDPYSDEVYQKAESNFERLQREAPLTLDSQECFYIYSLTMNGHRQNGLVAAVSVDDYDENRIKKHELTRQVKEDDRIRHTIALKAHTGPVFLTYRAKSDINTITEEVMRQEPIFSITTDDGIQHQIWRIHRDFNEKIISGLSQVVSLYVADGHHRAKSASRVREVCRKKNPGHTGCEPYNRFLSVIFPADQLNIFPYNRVVHDLNRLNSKDFIEGVKAGFDVKKTQEKVPECKGAIHMYLEGTWYQLLPKSFHASGTIVESLDVSILQNNLLEPLLGIKDPRTDTRIDFIGGIHGTAKLENLVDNGKGAVAFSLFPVTVDEIMDISDAGMIMPPKSTWFEPKLRDGLLCHCF